MCLGRGILGIYRGGGKLIINRQCTHVGRAIPRLAKGAAILAATSMARPASGSIVFLVVTAIQAPTAAAAITAMGPAAAL